MNTKPYVIYGEDHGSGNGAGIMGFYETLEEVKALPSRLYGIKLLYCEFNGEHVHVFNKK